MVLCVRTAGETLAFASDLDWVEELAREALHGASGGSPTARPSVRVEIERSRRAFPVARWSPVTRGVWSQGGDVVVPDVGTSGFDLLARLGGDVPTFVFRWRPPPRTRAAGLVLRSRQLLLARAVLVQYPPLWVAAGRGVAPLHAPACTAGGAVLMLSGPAGVGKTTLIADALASGGQAVADNVVTSDGRRCWGLVEPQRIEGAGGHRMPHGRGERVMPNRVDGLEPDRILVLRRADHERSGPGPRVRVAPCPPDRAARNLVAGTWMAGELRRFWPLAATLALASGRGPVQPPVAEVAAQLAARVPAFEVSLRDLAGVRLADLAHLTRAESETQEQEQVPS